ncbi:AsnC family transcriptional regulator, partial [Pseudoalteromonas sp.]
MTSPNRLRMLDRIDLAILDALQKNGRISNVNLAKQV